MQKIAFNNDWICYRTRNREQTFEVTIPHDAMLLDKKCADSQGGVNTGWYDAQDYTYEKRFTIPNEYKGKKIIFEFEGIYRKAVVFLNNKRIAYHSYGYTGFYVDMTENLRWEEENELRIEVENSDQPNSRWYSGTGIYRPVWMYVLPENHIRLDGIRITTLDYRKPFIQVEVNTVSQGEIAVEILERDKILASEKGICDGKYICRIMLPHAKTWEPDRPYLYECRVKFGEDVQKEQFGIRMVECSPEKGFTINGKRVILRGACIHHDNGILGACAYEFAERRKVKILKENGYNAIRSAHNPCSKAMLRACDESGMLVMDEYVDAWYIHKTRFDYASEVMKNYKDDLKDIVAKDYNHPSVVLYSTGNEVSETAQKKGIQFCGALTQYLHKLDHTRPVTC
ncbi:MAG: glycoside hydrolase family 2 protein, partial [Oliverpabstia sp.]